MSQLRNRRRFIGLCLVLGPVFMVGQSLAGNNVKQNLSAKQAVRATDLSAQGGKRSIHRKTGMTNFIGTGPQASINIPTAVAGQTSPQNAMASVRTYGSLFGIVDPINQLRILKQSLTKDGRSKVRYQQLHQGIAVIGGELNVNMNSVGRMLSMNGEISPTLVLVTQATFTATQASANALAAVSHWHGVDIAELIPSVAELSVYDPRLVGPSSVPPSLVWRIEVTAKGNQPIREFVLVDAKAGFIRLHFNQVHTVKNRETYDSLDGNAALADLVCDESSGDNCTNGVNPAADAAHLFAGQTYDFFATHHGRDSMDNNGLTLRLTVNTTNSYYYCPGNATWFGTRAVFCVDMVTDDIVGHELAHGFTQYTSNLLYNYQSGAINESMSDIWGEFVDITNGNNLVGEKWKIGEGSARNIIRDMATPSLFGDPEKMTNLNITAGVHTNSGVNNKAVYLMVDGGSFNGQTITGLGIPKVAKIYYEAQINLLTSGSDYLDLYNALDQACANLVGTEGITTNDCDQVHAATLAVEMDMEPSTAVVDVCPMGFAAEMIFFDDFEGGINPLIWTLDHATNTTSDWSDFSALGPYASSGTHSLNAGYVTAVSDQRADISINVPDITGRTPYLHFSHSFDFEESDIDGGVLEYRSGGGAWTDASALFTNTSQNYTGTLASSDNPLAGKDAFTNRSYGYVSTKLDLSSFAGQTIDVRWRVGTNTTPLLDFFLFFNFGWVIDDVLVYTCNSLPTLSDTATPAVIDEDTSAGPIGFTVNDAETAVADLTITATSSNTTLVPVSNIVIGNNGAMRPVTITPVENESGVTMITLTVTDGSGTARRRFPVTVNAINDIPTLSLLTDQTIDEDTDTSAINFIIGDIETDPADLIVTASSSEPTLVPTENIVFGTAGTDRNVTISPAENENGSTVITLAVFDGTDTFEQSFNLTVTAVNDSPLAPELVSPNDGATNVDGESVLFDWDPSTDVDGDNLTYVLYYCEDSGSGCDPEAGGTLLVLGDQPKLVMAGLGGGAGITFLIFLVIGRRHRVVFVSMVIILAVIWLGACSSEFKMLPSVQSPDEKVIKGLSPDTTYVWKVKANDGNGGIADSAVWNFTTAP